jgi:hypothetical protein
MYTGLRFTASKHESTESAFIEYGMLVNDYVARHLTHASDILNAFDGIVQVLEHTMETKFLKGIPERWFDQALLWNWNGRYLLRGPLFAPTWSWAGWQNIGPALSCWVDSGTVNRLLTWHIASPNNLHLRAIQSTGLAQSSHDRVARSRLGLSDVDLGITASSYPAIARENVLVAMTARNTFHLSLREFDVAPDHFLSTNYRNQYFKIHDLFERCIGWIRIDPAYFKPLTNDMTGFDFVLLSEFAPGIHTFYHKDLLSQIEEATAGTRSKTLMNVMLIEKCSETTVSRVAVGWVTEEAWTAAKPRPYLLQLE